MGRWEPNAHGRLQEAALELYAERGFDQTTVAEIAARAGLTERTFFRHFTDKREVLFRGAGELERTLVAAVDDAPAAATAFEAVAAALQAPGSVFVRDFARRRQAVILASPELQERELVKLAALATAIAAALRRRGIAEPAAGLAAETAIALFRVCFERWLEDPGERPWASHALETLSELRELTAGAAGA